MTDQLESPFKHGSQRPTSSRLRFTEQAELLVLPGNELKIWELKLRLQAAASGSYQNKSSGTCQAAHMRGEGEGVKRRQTEAGVELVCLTPTLLSQLPRSRARLHQSKKMRGVWSGGQLSPIPFPPRSARLLPRRSPGGGDAEFPGDGS